MLILTRWWKESVVLILPDQRRVRIEIVRCGDEKVWLGFEAPEDIVINRLEVQERMDAGVKP